MIETDLIRRVEELSMNAWPALQTLHDDGWVLHYADGYTRRANAVYPLYAGSKTLQKKIGACEAFYRAKGQRVIFKLTEASLPTGLDETLAAYGYKTDAQTAVQILAPVRSGLDLRRWEGIPSLGVVLSETPGGAWLAAYARMSNLKDGEMLTHGQILGAILPAKRFAAINLDGKIIACGLGVLQNGWIGFYDIRTDSAFRRQGHALGVMAALLAWAKAEGAVRGYLQVMIDNPPALALYEKLGFREAYRYWYRVKSS